MASGPAGHEPLHHAAAYRTASEPKRAMGDFSLTSAAGPYMTHTMKNQRPLPLLPPLIYQRCKLCIEW
jgi:hypothetical protein